jgi:hypothetical protein
MVRRGLPPGRSANLPIVASNGDRQGNSGQGRASQGRASQGKANLKLLSRALFAVSLTALAAVIVRLRGSGGTPPHRGGWRELTEADLERPNKH